MAAADRRIDAKLAGILLYALQIASANAKNSEQIVATNAIDELTRTEQGEEMAPEGSTCQPPEEEEESLATILMREVRRHQQEYQELSPDQSRQPNENKELTGKSQEEGEGYAAEPELLDEFGHPAPRWS